MYRRLKAKRKVIITISIVILLALYIFRTEYSLVRSIGAVGLLLLFYLADHLFDLDFERKHYFFIILIAVISFPLGWIYFLYLDFDKWMHFLMPIMISSIIFYMVSKLKIPLKWKLVFTFFIVVGILGIFEIGEYFLDTFFDFRLQGIYIYASQTEYYLHQTKIDDTMMDMILGVAGSAVYLVYTALFGRKKEKLFKS